MIVLVYDYIDFYDFDGESKKYINNFVIENKQY